MKAIVVKDLNNPNILKVEIRSDFPANAICEIDEALIGKAFKIIDEVDAFGFSFKKAVLDDVAEQNRLSILQTNINNQKWEILRNKRNDLLNACDYTQLLDCPFSQEKKQAYAVYRQSLRDLPQNTLDIDNIQWPIKPE